MHYEYISSSCQKSTYSSYEDLITAHPISHESMDIHKHQSNIYCMQAEMSFNSYI